MTTFVPVSAMKELRMLSPSHTASSASIPCADSRSFLSSGAFLMSSRSIAACSARRRAASS
eukprot:3139375-Prymnesium_polylepis.1